MRFLAVFQNGNDALQLALFQHFMRKKFGQMKKND